MTAAFAQQITKFIGQDNRTDYGAGIQLAFFYSSFGTDYSDLGDDVAYLQRYFLKSRARSRFPYISKIKIAGLDACDIWVGDYWYLSK